MIIRVYTYYTSLYKYVIKHNFILYEIGACQKIMALSLCEKLDNITGLKYYT